jgi:endogenous inhibitor of DNA gyrase (YacG/DUF329 family)
MAIRTCKCCGSRFETKSTASEKLCSPRCVLIKSEWETSQTTIPLHDFYRKYYVLS